MSQYSASVPDDVQVRPEIHAFFERFFEVSDKPGAHEEYAEMFSSDGQVIMGMNCTRGREEIVTMRHGMWERVARRSHRPLRLYAFGHGSDDIMLYGNVEYVFKDGKETEVEWAARARFTTAGGDLKLDFYQVYIDSAAMSQAK